MEETSYSISICCKLKSCFINTSMYAYSCVWLHVKFDYKAQCVGNPSYLKLEWGKITIVKAIWQRGNIWWLLFSLKYLFFQRDSSPTAKGSLFWGEQPGFGSFSDAFCRFSQHGERKPGLCQWILWNVVWTFACLHPLFTHWWIKAMWLPLLWRKL